MDPGEQDAKRTLPRKRLLERLKIDRLLNEITHRARTCTIVLDEQILNGRRSYFDTVHGVGDTTTFGAVTRLPLETLIDPIYKCL